MWLSYSKITNSCLTQGLVERFIDQRTLYVSENAPALKKIEDLRDAEYMQAIEVDPLQRTVRFGRDYLGHYPLYYAYTDQDIIISDDLKQITAWLAQHKVNTTISEFAMALYMSMGYVPQGFTIFNEVHSCRNASLYQWLDGKVSETDLFKPIAVDSDCSLMDIDAALETEIERVFAVESEVDVWCSGGLDSSIIAMLCNQQGRNANLLTLQHVGDFRQGFGDGELPFAIELQKHLNATLSKIEFSPLTFNNSYYDFLSLHPSPVLDPVVTPKYMLAKKTRSLALTGEGGDPLFAGVKNNTVYYMHQKNPELSLGMIYALAHQRFYDQLPQIFRHGQELAIAVDHYLQSIWERYPGSILRKLFYVNTFEKQGGMIFPKNYYAGIYGNVRVRHPLTSLQVYKTAFALDDGLKYQYPHGKLALSRLYGKRLPAAIVNRKKSGTLVPMDVFLKHIHSGRPDFDGLMKTGYFEENLLFASSQRELSQMDNCSVFLRYALLSLTKWLELNGGNHNATSNISTGASYL